MIMVISAPFLTQCIAGNKTIGKRFDFGQADFVEVWYMKKKAKLSLVIVLSLSALIMTIVFALFANELKTLNTLKQIDPYGMYRMAYHGDYGFDDFLEQGAASDKEIEEYVTKRLLKGIPIQLNVTESGCTAFVTRNENGDIIFARNYNDLNIGEGYTEFDRYDQVINEIENRNNSFHVNDVISLLNDIGVYGEDGIDKLQWSVIYNLTDSSGKIWAHRNKNNVLDFELQ